MKTGQKYIALISPIGSPAANQLAAGVFRYALSKSWKVESNQTTSYLYPDEMDQYVEHLSKKSVDGVIVWARDQELYELILQHEIPCLNINTEINHEAISELKPDYFSMGQTAAGLFRQHSISHVAVYASTPYRYIDDLVSGIQQTYTSLKSLTMFYGYDQVNACLDWIEDHDRPMVFPCYSYVGSDLVIAALQRGYKIPDDFQLLTIGDFDTRSPVELSYIDLSYKAFGYRAGEVLNEVMRGDAIGTRLQYRYEAKGILERESTTFKSIPDAEIASIMEFIRDHVSDQLAVEDILDRFCLSRSYLQRKFRDILGSTPYQEILLSRLKLAQRLLVDSDLSISEIADRSGFGGQDQLTKSFRKEYGYRPREYRKKHSF